jgi:hypothetical protein
LPNGSNVYNYPPRSPVIGSSKGGRREEPAAFFVNPRHMRVPHETDFGLSKLGKTPPHLDIVNSIRGKHILPDGIPGGTMHEEDLPLFVALGHLVEIIPESEVFFLGVVTRVQSIFGPLNRQASLGVKVCSVKHRCLLMISHKTNFAGIHDHQQTFPWFGSITDNVPQTKKTVSPLPLCVIENIVQSGCIAVDIGYKSDHVG